MTNDNDKTKEIAELRVELFESLENKVNEKFDRAKDLIKITVGTALKVLGGAIAVLLIIITVLGIKTFNDIKESVEIATKEEIKLKLNKDNPTVEYLRRVDNLYQQALIDSYLLSIKKTEQEIYQKSTEINERDTRVLLSILKDRKSTIDQFSSAAYILRKRSSYSSWQFIASNFIQLIQASDSAFAFMNSDKKRKEILIIQLANRRFEAARKLIRKIALDDGNNEKLRTTAIRYLAEIGDYTSNLDLEHLSTSSIPDIQQAAILALARIEPKSKILNNWIISFDKKNIRKVDEITFAFNVIVELMKGHPKHGGLGPSDPNAKYRFDLAKRIYNKIFDSNVRFYSMPQGVNKYRSLSIGFGDSPVLFYHVDSNILFGSGFSPINSLLLDYAKSNRIDKLGRLIRKLSVRDRDKPLVILKAEFTGSAKVTTNENKIIDKNNAVSGAALYWNAVNGKDGVKLVWLDSSAIRLSGHLKQVDDANGLSFKLETDERFADR